MTAAVRAHHPIIQVMEAERGLDKARGEHLSAKARYEGKVEAHRCGGVGGTTGTRGCVGA